MARNEIFTGKTKEEAIEEGLQKMGLTKDEVTIEVIEEGKKKLFSSVPAQVKLTEIEKKTDGERAVVFLEGLFELLNQDTVVALVEEGEKIVVELKSETTKSLIGRRGETIDALQVLAGAVANTGRHDYKRVVVNCGNYREEREETLKRVAEKLAAKAVRLGKKVRLEPMNPYERRIIHAVLVDNEEVTTKSEGKDPARYVVIIPKNMKPYDKNKNRNNRYGNRKDGYNRDNRNGRDNRGYNRDNNKPYQKRDLPKEGTPQSSGTSLGKSSGGYKRGGFSGFFGTYLGNSKDGADNTEGGEQNNEE